MKRFLLGDHLSKTLTALAALTLLTAFMCLWPTQMRLKIDGVLQPEIRRNLFTELDGVVEKVNVDHNSVVRKGDLLMELNNEPLRLKALELSGQIKTNREQVDGLRRQQLQQKNLKEEERLSIAGRIEQLEIQNKSLEEQLVRVERQLDSLKIYTPIDGTVFDLGSPPATRSTPCAGKSAGAFGGGSERALASRADDPAESRRLCDAGTAGKQGWSVADGVCPGDQPECSNSGPPASDRGTRRGRPERGALVPGGGGGGQAEFDETPARCGGLGPRQLRLATDRVCLVLPNRGLRADSPLVLGTSSLPASWRLAAAAVAVVSLPCPSSGRRMSVAVAPENQAAIKLKMRGDLSATRQLYQGVEYWVVKEPGGTEVLPVSPQCLLHPPAIGWADIG